MTWFRGIAARVREAVGHRRFEAELDEELRYHLEGEAERLMMSGMEETAARREAARTFGALDRVKEETRDGAGFSWLDTIARDMRHSARGLRRSPSFAAATVLTLALGIGATTAIFSVVDSVLLEPLPYREPDRLVRLVEQTSPEQRWNLSMADFLAVREQGSSFESVAAFQTGSVSFTGTGSPLQIDVVRVSAEWFQVLGVRPAEGRGFRPGEDRPGAASVVVLDRAFRDRVFGVGADVIGADVMLDDVPHSVVGVLDAEQAALAGLRADAWPVLPLEPPARRGPFPFGGIGRLKPGRSLEDGRADLAAVSRSLSERWGDFNDGQARITPYPLKEMMLGDVGGGLWLVLGAVVGVLLIAVVNVGNLFLVRVGGREHELRMRAALGATSVRLAAQLLIESLVVAGAGGLAGVVFAWLGLKVLLVAAPPIPRLDEVGIDTTVLLATAAVTVAAALLFGMAPLARLLASRTVGPEQARGATAPGGGWARLRAALVMAEFALAFGVSTGAGLLVGSYVRLLRVDPGYEPERVVALRVGLPAARYPDYEAMQAFWTAALRRLGEAPELEAAGIGAAVPPRGSAGMNDFDLLDRPVAPGESSPQSLWSSASPGYFAALGVPLLRGRLFDEADRAAVEEARVILVSRSWARKYYPDREVLGARLYAGGDRSVAMTVIGVVGDVKYLGLDATDDAVVYEPHWQVRMGAAHLVVRGRGGTAEAVARVGREIAALDPELPLADVRTMDQRATDSLARPRYWTTLLGLFAALALTLAGVGVYGVLSHWVGTQRRELAIRLSLGAEPSRVRRLVLGRGLRLAGIGIALGIALSLGLARLLRTLIFEVSPQDPATLAAVALLLSGIALIACALPARSATSIEPAAVLKGE